MARRRRSGSVATATTLSGANVRSPKRQMCWRGFFLSRLRQKMKHPLLRRPQISAALVALAMLGANTAAVADSSNRQPPPARYIEECASCHAPFPAKMLPAASWQALLTSLDKHFGTDASIDAPTARALSQWLSENASRRTSMRPPQDRLTQSAEFVRKHREIATSVWLRPAIGGASNCAACHTNSAQGRFSEHDVRIPK